MRCEKEGSQSQHHTKFWTCSFSSFLTCSQTL